MAAMFIISTSNFICVLLLLALASTTQCSSASSKDIFILAGQSNMAGRGGVQGGKFWDGNVPKQCKPNPSILRLSSNLQWEEAREPLHEDIDVGKTCGVGPGLAFANEVLRIQEQGRGRGKHGSNDNFLLGLVPCAKGGTKIDEWRKGSVLYNELVRRASESVKGSNGGGKIKALLWYQGESDTVREEDAEGYKVKMENFVRDIRLDLHLPSLLVIQVALASGEGRFIEKVREAQLGLKLPNVKCVDAKGLALKADKLHLTAMSEAHLGIRLAHAYIAAASSTTTTSFHQFNHTKSYIPT